MTSVHVLLARAARCAAGLAACAAIFLTLTASTPLRGPAHPAGYQYVSPFPDSKGVSPLNNIVIRQGRTLDPASLSRASVVVTGATSGVHPGRLVLSDDGRTLVFKPDQPFAPGERVTVTMLRTPRAFGAAALAPVAFEFTVAMTNPVRNHAILAEGEDEGVAGMTVPTGVAAAPQRGTLDDDLPASYPPVTLLASDHPDPGYVFCTPVNRGTRPPQALNMMILDNNAMPIFYRKRPSRPADFKKLDDGRLVFNDAASYQYYAMNTFYAFVDSFAMGNGYVTDNHDIDVLPNDHALLMAYDPQPVDMSQIVPDGDPDAIVTGLVIQEIDANKNVVFQWRSWDHFQITDMSDCHSLTDARIDYVHGNSLDYDLDGNILLSCRSMNEVTKIDRQTGDIIWRFGKNAKNNQFTILDDPLGFSDQHDARRLPNGNLTIFDNHHCIDSGHSRAVEYEMDEQTMTARLVWEYHLTPEQTSPGTGNVQRRASGGTLICWGQAQIPPNIIDLHPDGSTAWAIQFWSPPTPTASYRAFRFPWRAEVFTPDVDAIDFGTVTVGESVQRPLVVTNNTDAPITFTNFVTLDDAFSVVEAPPVTAPAGGSVTVQAKFSPGHGGDFHSSLYVRSSTDNQVIAYPVEVSGVGNAPPVCDAAVASPAILWPPNHKMTDIGITGVTDPDGDPVTITVTGIMQNEPLDGEGDGNTCPDAAIDGGAAKVRAERAGPGDGRLYQIAFTAADPNGASCDGTVMVFVPHDEGDLPPVPPATASVGPDHRDDPIAGKAVSWEFVDALGPCIKKNGKHDPEPADNGPAAAPTWSLSLKSFEASGSRAVVEYTLAADGPARLAVFDLSGRRVRTLENGIGTAGPHHLEWNTGGLSPGVYFYRLQAGEASLTRMVRIIR